MINDKIFYLFSSSQRPLYKQDNVNALCYPSSFIMHFRYDKKWISSEIIQKTPEDLEDSEAILIVVDIEERNERLYPHFYPIRKAKIKKVDREGTVYHFYFELSSYWVDYKDVEGRKDYHSCLESLTEKPVSGDKRLDGKFASLGEVQKDINYSSDSEAWESIIDKIGNLIPYKETLFFRFSRIYDAVSTENLKITKFDNLRCGYTLKSRKKYNIDLAFNYGKEPPVIADRDRVVVKVDDNFYKPIPDELMLGFRADKQNIYLSTKDMFFDTLTDLCITFKEGIVEGPNVVIPIKIQYDRLNIWGSFIAFFIGLFLASGVIEFSQLPQPVMKFFGSLISTWVLYRLYRNLK